jgi:hypothetical protein
VNPSRRRRGKGGRFVKQRVRRNPARRRARRRNPLVMDLGGRKGLRRYRRNPVRAGRRDFVAGTLMPVAIGAGGALATDVALGFVPLPAALQSPMLRPLVKAGAALAIGFVAGMLTDRSTGAKVAAGALTVVAYDSLRGLLQRVAPQVPLAGLAENEYPVIGYAGEDGMGEVLIDVPAAGMGDAIGEPIYDGVGDVYEDA